MTTGDDLEIALACSDRAARLALEYFEAGTTTTIKSDGSPVTEADPAVEELLRTQIGGFLPEDAFLGEELGSIGTSERTWVLDPIDGTSYFVRANPHWRVHVALQVSGRTEVAVVTAPALGRQWWAALGRGAFESPWPRQGAAQQLAVTNTTEMHEALFDAANDKSRARLPPDIAVAGPNERGWCAGLIDLVRGDVDCFFAECCQVWDHAPWILIVQEAGGTFTNRLGGTRGDHRGGLYSNGALHDAVLAAVGYPSR